MTRELTDTGERMALLPADVPRDAIIERFIEVFSKRYGAVPGTISDEEYAEAEALVESKFATDAWLKRVP